jgi:hypothetical protein
MCSYKTGSYGMFPKEKAPAGIHHADGSKTAADLINLSFQLDYYEFGYSARDDHELGEYVVRYLPFAHQNLLCCLFCVIIYCFANKMQTVQEL